MRIKIQQMKSKIEILHLNFIDKILILELLKIKPSIDKSRTE